MLSKKLKFSIRIAVILAAFLFIIVNIYTGVLRTKRRESYISPFYKIVDSIESTDIVQIEIHESDDLGKFVALKRIIDNTSSIDSFVVALKEIHPWTPNRPALFTVANIKIILRSNKEVYMVCYLKYRRDNPMRFEERAFCTNPTSETQPKFRSIEKDKIIGTPSIKSEKLYTWLNNQGLLEF